MQRRKVTTHMADDVLKVLKANAALRGISMADVLDMALREGLPRLRAIKHLEVPA